jgi:hypothetical protein
MWVSTLREVRILEHFRDNIKDKNIKWCIIVYRVYGIKIIFNRLDRGALINNILSIYKWRRQRRRCPADPLSYAAAVWPQHGRSVESSQRTRRRPRRRDTRLRVVIGLRLHRRRWQQQDDDRARHSAAGAGDRCAEVGGSTDCVYHVFAPCAVRVRVYISGHCRRCCPVMMDEWGRREDERAV